MSLDHRELAVICFWHVNYEMNKHRDIQVLYWFTVTAPPQINAALFLQQSGEYWLFHINANIAVVFVGYGWNVSRFKKANVYYVFPRYWYFEQNKEKVRLRTIALHRWKVLNKQRQIPKKSTIKVNLPYLPTSWAFYHQWRKTEIGQTWLARHMFIQLKKNYVNVIFLLPACLFNFSSLSSNAYANKENFTLFLIEKN